jgi:hypothetical protein
MHGPLYWYCELTPRVSVSEGRVGCVVKREQDTVRFGEAEVLILGSNLSIAMVQWLRTVIPVHMSRNVTEVVVYGRMVIVKRACRA